MAGDEDEPAAGQPPVEQEAGLPEPPRPAFTVGAPVPLRAEAHETRWAPVRRAAAARAAPSERARTVARLPLLTPEGTANLVQALGRTEDARGALWVRARLPGPDQTVGWVPRAALGGYETVRTRLVIDRKRLRATLLRDGRAILRAPVAVGAARFPTPRGEFFVRNELTGYRSAAYGPLAFGTSAQSTSVKDWPGGGWVGIHGTDRPDLVPGRVSHGCVRLRNPDIVRLGRLMPVGTPLTIR